MRILLLGDYSNVHATLAAGLKRLGHEAVVVSNGDGWKNYPRDIDLSRPKGRLGALRYTLRLLALLPKFRGFDVVQLINPVFLDLRAPRITPFYRFIRRHNQLLSLGAFGMDHYWVKTCMEDKAFRYSDFNIGPTLRTDLIDNQLFIRDWLHGEKAPLNQLIAREADCIVTGLYEYDRCYRPRFPAKTTFIPFPIDVESVSPKKPRQEGAPVRFFIGIQRARSAYKGTDIMLRALERVGEKYPDRCLIRKAESVPFSQYQSMMDDSDVLLDQLYSYTPAMNALLAMAKGLVVVGGGEEENYTILGERELRPIVNVEPNEESVFQALEQLVLHPQQIERLSRQSIEYIRKHHDHLRVAQQYIDLWQSHLSSCS